MKRSLDNLWDAKEHASFIFLTHSCYDTEEFVWAENLKFPGHSNLMTHSYEGWKKWWYLKERVENMHEPICQEYSGHGFGLLQVRDGRLSGDYPESKEIGHIRCALSIGSGGPVVSFDYQVEEDACTVPVISARRPQLLSEPNGKLSRNPNNPREEYEGWNLLQTKNVQTASHSHGCWFIVYRYEPEGDHNHGTRDFLTISALQQLVHSRFTSPASYSAEIQELLRFLTDENNDIPEYY